jgi:hypothetical protein
LSQADHESQSEGWLGGAGYLSHRLDGGFGLQEHDASVIQKYPACGGHFDTTRTPREKRCADFMFEVADLTT